MKLLAVPGVLLCFMLIISCLIIFGTSALPESNKLDNDSRFNTVDYTTLPPQSYFTFDNGSSICYREYPAAVDKIMIYIHGITGSSRNMHVIAEYMSNHNIAHGIALDMPGHGDSGEKGKLDYIGQLEDDISEVIRQIRINYPQKRMTIIGFSMGGGFAIRFAGSEYGSMVHSYIFLAPFLHQDSPIKKPPEPGNEDQEMSVYLPRIIGLSTLNLFTITCFNNLPIIEYRIPSMFQEDYTSTYSYNLSENFRPHRDYIGDIRNLKVFAVLIAGENDEGIIASKYRDELAHYSKQLTFEFIPGANHFDLVLDEKVFERIVAALR
ncbi:MAG: alpha/beta hydrolase [Spirochaetales bacterium]|nr:alpha/beta hydrolase [Spirochaetales bacterium]